MKKNQLILGLVVLVALVALVFWGRDRIHFDFGVFRSQIALVDWRRIALAIGCIYLGYCFRAVRWALLLRHNKKVGLFSLLGTQVIGFTAVALIGRVADLVRPYLVAKRTNLPLSSQIAVYIVERLFDAGSMALIFSVAMIWVPTDQILKVAAHLLFARFGGLALTLFGALFLFAVRLAGGGVATFFERALAPVSKTIGNAIGNKIRTFRAGLDTMRSFSEFAVTAALSLGMWLLISLAYFEGCRAFVASPELASLTAPKCVLLMIASGGASIIQLPIIGWFSQIGLVVVALVGVVGASPEASTACAALLLVITFLSIIPVGLIWARFEHVSLRKITVESEHAGEVSKEDTPTEENKPAAPDATA
ncbi:MAG: lysylphosphatidylglycerol synthase transmembrane domain-containing protein [Terracidiphilus sp.]